ITAGILSTESDNKELAITTGASKTLLIGSLIRDLDVDDHLIVIKNGVGTLTLTGTSSYTGGLYVNSGTVSIATIADTGTPSSAGKDGAIHLTSSGRLVYMGPTASSNRDFVFEEGGNTIQVN